MATTKKVKILGTEQYINATTGELQTFNVQSIEERDYNFKKIWMRDFLSSMELLGTQKTKVAFWIIDKIKKDNSLAFTYQQIEKELGISVKTISMTVKALLEADFMRKVMPSVYHVNPDVVFQGGKDQRLYSLSIYHGLDKPQAPSPQEQLSKILESISLLQEKAARLQEKMNENN